MRFFLDEGVPVSVGKALEAEGFTVIYFNEAALPGSPDPIVAAIAMNNNAILVATDGDMRQLAKTKGVGQSRYRKLSLLKLSCKETRAAQRIGQCAPFIKLQMQISEGSHKRRLFVEVLAESIKIFDAT
jgi:predicted nuclease of predicted toxin-antitoxin system